MKYLFTIAVLPLLNLSIWAVETRPSRPGPSHGLSTGPRAPSSARSNAPAFPSQRQFQPQNPIQSSPNRHSFQQGLEPQVRAKPALQNPSARNFRPPMAPSARAVFGRTRIDSVMKKNAHVNQIVSQQTNRWQSMQRPIIEKRAPVYRGLINQFARWNNAHPSFRNRWWFRHRFFGGCYFGFFPLFDIWDYFYNPLVYWFFVPTYDPVYYRTWYGDDLDAYPDLEQSFPYSGLYYPTENLRQLLFAVSAMPIDEQADFRTAIMKLSKELAHRVANASSAHVQIKDGDIVVTHYAILGDDNGVSLDGFVNQNGDAYNFKGIVDMRQPETSDAFVTSSMDREPSPEELSQLDAINAKIAALGGETEPGEPTTPSQLEADPDR